MIEYEELGNKVQSIDELIQKIWGSPDEISDRADYWKTDRAILCARNDLVTSINEEILAKMKSEVNLLNT